MVRMAQFSASIEQSMGPLRYLDADTRTWSRSNDLGEEVQARLRAEWGKLGEWRGDHPDYDGLDL
jgi:hypothetical protein